MGVEEGLREDRGGGQGETTGGQRGAKEGAEGKYRRDGQAGPKEGRL